MNFTALGGNLVKSPEQRGGDKGPVVMRVGVANRRKDKEGEWQVFYDNFDVTVWGDNRVKALAFKEGDEVLITGRLKRDSYEKDGTKVYQTVVNVDVVAGIPVTSSNGNEEGSSKEETEDWKF